MSYKKSEIETPVWAKRNPEDYKVTAVQWQERRPNINDLPLSVYLKTRHSMVAMIRAMGLND